MGVDLSKSKKEVYLPNSPDCILQCAIHTDANLDNLSLPKYDNYFSKPSQYVLQDLSHDIFLSLKLNQRLFAGTTDLLVLQFVIRLTQMLKRLLLFQSRNRQVISILTANHGDYK